MDEKGRAERNEGCLNHLVRKKSNSPVVSLGGVWKKIFKKPLVTHRPYREDIHCRKCGNRIRNYTWFYVKRVGNRNQKTEYYCVECFEGLWHE